MTFRDKHENETPNEYQTAKTNHLAEFNTNPSKPSSPNSPDRFRNTKDYINSGDYTLRQEHLNRANR
jgi:hypothetical protein